jgi:hypothetical protein
MKHFLVATVMSAGLLAVLAGQANADAVFDLAWSGAGFGNTASATGTITMNLADIANPGTTFQNVSPFVTDFSITVTGAGSGDGTFNFADFNGGPAGGFDISTPGALDFTRQLVGQSTDGEPWGSSHVNDIGDIGDFNIFNNGIDPNAPTESFFFQISTADGNGDGDNGHNNLYLTSFAPASAVPEPSSAIPLSAALLALALVVRKRTARTNS